MESVKKFFWFILFLFGLFAESRGSEEEKEITFKRLVGESDNFDHEYKCAFVGDAGVGKTQILNRLTKNTFEEQYKVTVGSEFFFNSYKIKSSDDISKTIKYTIADFTGYENFREIITGFLRKIKNHIVFFVYEVNRKNSFENIQNWLNVVKENAQEDAKYVLVGNKIDLEAKRQVTKEEAEKFAGENSMEFIEVSAKTGDGIFYKKENIPLYDEEEINTTTTIKVFGENSLEYVLGEVTKKLMVRDFNEDNNTNNDDPKKTDDSKDIGLCSCCKKCF